MFRYKTRDLLWLMLAVVTLVAWWMDRTQLVAAHNDIQSRFIKSLKNADRLHDAAIRELNRAEDEIERLHGTQAIPKQLRTSGVQSRESMPASVGVGAR